jgi:hypothetical protein
MRGRGAFFCLPKVVIPAKAGIHCADAAAVETWIPAFAGMTAVGGDTSP